MIGEKMDIFEAINNRQTYRLKFQQRPISENDLLKLLEAFRWGPSPHTVQPAEIVLVNDPSLIKSIADLTTQAAKLAYGDSDYWQGVYSWLRFSKEEFNQKGDGVYIDKVPVLLKPFIKKLLAPEGFKLLNQLNVTSKLAKENYGHLVHHSPLIVAIVQDIRRKVPGKRGGMWGMFGIGAAIENIWLAATALNIGFQPVTAPFESKDIVKEIEKLLQITDTHRLIFLVRMGYIDAEAERPSIGFTSRGRREQKEWVHYNTLGNLGNVSNK
jgi:nitroreductase